MKPPGEWKCDFCDKPAIKVAGESNGVLVCDEHMQRFLDRELMGRRLKKKQRTRPS